MISNLAIYLEFAAYVLPDSVRFHDWGAGNTTVHTPEIPGQTYFHSKMIGIETKQSPHKIIVFELDGSETEKQLIDLLKSKSEELLAQS